VAPPRGKQIKPKSHSGLIQSVKTIWSPRRRN